MAVRVIVEITESSGMVHIERSILVARNPEATALELGAAREVIKVLDEFLKALASTIKDSTYIDQVDGEEWEKTKAGAVARLVIGRAARAQK